MSLQHTSTQHPSLHRPPLAATCLDLLDRARGSLLLACRTGDIGERYIEAHLGALRAAAAVLAARSSPGMSGISGIRPTGRVASPRVLSHGSSRSRPRSVWELLPRVAPELAEWSAFFAASARRRAVVERGGQIVARESDDLLRQSQIFLEIVEDLLGMPQAQARLALPGYVVPVFRSGSGPAAEPA